MIFETHILEEPLVNYIESIFYYKGFKPDHSIERVVPTGHLFIIFELDGFNRNTFDNESLKTNGSYSNAWISGIHKNYISISAHQNSEMLVVQFKTSGAYPFLKIPVSELNNKIVLAEEVFGDEILALRNEIINKKTAQEKFVSVEKWLETQFDRSKSAPKEILSVLEQTQTKPVSESSAIIALYPNSQKHLINQFKKYFGLTPKAFHRIYRFNEILKKFRTNSN